MRQAQSIQLVWFVSASEGLTAQEIFSIGFEEEFSSSQTNKTVSTSTPFLSQASGTRDGMTLAAQIQPGRVDIVLQPSLDQIGQDGMPDMLEAEFVFGKAQDIVMRLAPRMESCFRVAMVSNLTRLVDTLDEAAAEIVAHTGIDLSPDGVSDLSVSANRTKLVREDMRMNRLLRFSVLQLQLLNNMMVGFNQGIVATQITKFAALLSLDFNSVPLSRSLSAAEQIEMFRAIAEETRRFDRSERAIGCLA